MGPRPRDKRVAHFRSRGVTQSQSAAALGLYEVTSSGNAAVAVCSAIVIVYKPTSEAGK